MKWETMHNDTNRTKLIGTSPWIFSSLGSPKVGQQCFCFHGGGSTGRCAQGVVHFPGETVRDAGVLRPAFRKGTELLEGSRSAVVSWQSMPWIYVSSHVYRDWYRVRCLADSRMTMSLASERGFFDVKHHLQAGLSHVHRGVGTSNAVPAERNSSNVSTFVCDPRCKSY